MLALSYMHSYIEITWLAPAIAALKLVGKVQRISSLMKMLANYVREFHQDEQ